MALEIAVNIFLTMAMLFAAICFLQGIFSGKQNSRFKIIIPLESIFIKNIDDKVALEADRLCFLICIFGAILTLINTILIFVVNMQNISMAIVVGSFIIAWLIRIFFIFHYNKHIENIPRIWFFKD